MKINEFVKYLIELNVKKKKGFFNKNFVGNAANRSFIVSSLIKC